MGYVENNLNSKEKLVAKAPRAWWAFLPSIVWLIVLIVVSAVVPNKIIDAFREAAIQSGSYEMFTADYSFVKYIFWGITVVCGVIPLAVRLIELYCSALCVTTNRVFGKTGVLKRNTLDTSLNKIDNVVIKETFWGRLFRFSSIRIKTTSADFIFPFVADVQKFKNVIMNEIEQHEERARLAQAEAMADAMRASQAAQAKDIANAIKANDNK
ncbi:MAG: PH domain-containing protein [Clostridia bacterium]|nr:PH domain-containing protein [Clostridia bacterium]